MNIYHNPFIVSSGLFSKKTFWNLFCSDDILAATWRPSPNRIYRSFSGQDIHTNEEVAVKLESFTSRHPQLHVEVRLYKILSGGVGIPKVRIAQCISGNLLFFFCSTLHYSRVLDNKFQTDKIRRSWHAVCFGQHNAPLGWPTILFLLFQVYWNGYDGEFNVMVMELLGPSLEDLFNFCERRFSLKTTLLLADQMVSSNWDWKVDVLFFWIHFPVDS